MTRKTEVETEETNSRSFWNENSRPGGNEDNQRETKTFPRTCGQHFNSGYREKRVAPSADGEGNRRGRMGYVISSDREFETQNS